MSYLEEQKALAGWFSAGWGATTAVQWENTDHNPIRDSSGVPVPYVVFTVQPESAEQIEFGKPTNNYRHRGFIIVQVLVPEDTGTAAVLGLADQAAAIFRSKQFAVPDLIVKSPRIGRVGRNSGYYQLNVIVGYHRDSTF